MYKEGVKDQLDKLDYDLVGLLPVKQRVREIAALLVLDKMRRKLGFDTAVPSLHMCFTGAPGTGQDDGGGAHGPDPREDGLLPVRACGGRHS